MSKRDKFQTHLQNYLIEVADEHGPALKPMIEITHKMLDATARQSKALKEYLKAVQSKTVKSDHAVELYLANDAAFKAFEECERIAELAREQ